MRAYLSRTSAPTPVLIRAANGFQIILGKVRPNTSPGREPSTSSDHCSTGDHELRYPSPRRELHMIIKIRRIALVLATSAGIIAATTATAHAGIGMNHCEPQ